MSQSVQPADLLGRLRELERRLRALETERPHALGSSDAGNQLRTVLGSLDVLGGGYVGKFGIVVLNSSGAVVFQQYA